MLYLALALLLDQAFQICHGLVQTVQRLLKFSRVIFPNLWLLIQIWLIAASCNYFLPDAGLSFCALASVNCPRHKSQPYTAEPWRGRHCLLQPSLYTFFAYLLHYNTWVSTLFSLHYTSTVFVELLLLLTMLRAICHSFNSLAFLIQTSHACAIPLHSSFYSHSHFYRIPFWFSGPKVLLMQQCWSFTVFLWVLCIKMFSCCARNICSLSNFLFIY